MRSLSKFSILFLAAALAVTLAQGPPAGAGQGNGNRFGATTPAGQCSLDLAHIQTLNGAVTAVNIGLGAQLPSIEVAGVTVRLGPAWFILESGLEIQVGDQVTVEVASPLVGDGYVYAIRIQNNTRGGTLEFRQTAGTPGWTRQGRRNRAANKSNQGAGRVGAACGFTTTGTVNGTVASVTAGAGLGQPNLVLNVANAGAVSAMTIKLGPFRILQELGITLAPNDVISVDYGVSSCTGENVAIALTIGAARFVLRNADGTPAW